MQDKYDRLTEILNLIKEAIKLYNDLDENTNNKIKVEPIETKNVRKIYIGVYDDSYVGLFERITFSSTSDWYDKFGRKCYRTGELYKGINTNYIAIHLSHDETKFIDVWEPIGSKRVIDENTYNVDCKMSHVISFDDMRLIMHNMGKLDYYEIGKATNEEMLEVMDFAYEYYGLKNDKVKRLEK